MRVRKTKATKKLDMRLKRAKKAVKRAHKEVTKAKINLDRTRERGKRIDDLLRRLKKE